MLKLKDVRDAADTHTGKASDVSRQLAFAALAIAWIFKTDQSGGGIAVPYELHWPALCAVGVLALDLIQYGYASLAWQWFNRKKEIELNNSEEAEFTAPRWINWPSDVCFYGKLLLIVVCYEILLAYLIDAIV